MKKLFITLFILVAVGVGTIISLTFFLDKAIINGAETFGPELTGGKVLIEKVDLNILSGSGKISGITIGNPKGFATDAAIKLKSIQVAIDLKSLLGNKIRVKQVLIDGPEITYETSLKGNNLNTILANIQTATSSTEQNSTKPTGKEQPGKQMQIDDLLIKNGTISLSATILKGKALAVDLPQIHLQDIGKDGDDASIAEVTKKVFTKLHQATISAVSKSGLLDTKTTIKTIKEKVKGFFNSFGN